MPELILNNQFLKSDMVKSGDKIVFKDAGQYQKTTYQKKTKDGAVVLDEAGNPVMTEQFIITVDYQGAEYSLRINKTSLKILAGKFGKNTDSWVGKEATIEIMMTTLGKKAI